AARCGGAEHDMLGVFGRVMVLDLRRVEHPGVADQLIELRSKVRPMQAGGDQHPKGFRWNAGLEQGLDQWTKKEAIWYRPRNVADGDGSTSCSPGQLLERSHADRILNRLSNGGTRVCQGRHSRLTDHRYVDIVRQFERQFLVAVDKFRQHWLDSVALHPAAAGLLSGRTFGA